MKRQIRNILLGCAALLLASSCVEEGQFDKPVFANIKPYFLDINAGSASQLESAGGQVTVNVESMESAWSISGMPDWIKIEPSSGSKSTQVKVIYQENKSTTADRSAVLTLQSADSDWNFSKTFTVSQKRSLCYATPSESNITVDGKADNHSVTVNSNTTVWSVSALADLADWGTVTKNDDSKSFTVSLQPNAGNIARTGTVQITTADSKSTMTVTQRPAGITSSLETISYGVNGGNVNVEIESEAPWTAQTASSWIQVTPSMGAAGKVSVVVKTQPNYTLQERKGYIYLVLSENSKIEIPVEQGCVQFSLGASAMEFAAGPSNGKLAVTSNVGWSVAPGHSDWLSFSPGQASGDAEVTVSATDNNSVSARNGSFGIGLTVMDYVKNVEVTQKGHSFQLDSTALQYSDKAGTAPVEITSDGTWNAAAKNPWITVTPASGTGNGSITVSVTENTAPNSREGAIEINLGSKIYTVRVIQQGKYITLSDNLFNLTSVGGQIQVDLTTNDGWTASSAHNWVTLSNTSGQGDCHLTITVAQNKSTAARKDTVTIQPTNLNPLSIVIEEAARYMNLTTGSVSFFVSGGTTDNIQVETDGLVQATPNVDWLTVNTLANGLFTITAQANTTHFDRNGTVTVAITDLDSGELSKTITVTQDKRTDDIIAFADANFKAVLINSGFDLDNDNDISLDEAALITQIDASGKSITTLSGIEYMTALQTLDCSNNSLTELDLSSNTALATLNVTGNTALKQVTVPASFSNTAFMAAQLDRQSYLVPAGNATVFTAAGVNFTMITVPGGTFTMGATTEQGTDATDAEKPAHQVTLTTFSISQTEVTQALWTAVMGSNPSEVVGDDMPVSQLSWSMARLFIQKLNQLTGQKFRFATEAEWEFAARGGNWSKGYKYSGGNDLDNVGWHNMNRGSHFFHQVATAYPNELGLYDMSGNLIELCMDWDGSYQSAVQTDPTGTASGQKHILRGGSWASDAVNCRVSARDSVLDNPYQDVGLRLVLGGADVPDSWYGQWLNIPDASFREALMWAADANTDEHLTIGELQAINSFSVGGFGDVADMTGLEYMTGLTSLNCAGNQITTLNVKNNVKLKSLLCSSNNLRVLDISNNIDLEILNAQNNPALDTIYIWPGFNAADYPNFKIPSSAIFKVK